MTAKDLIEKRIEESGQWLAVHEMQIMGYSENCIATRCPEMVKEGRLVGRYRDGQNYKEWGLPIWVLAPVQFKYEENGQYFFA